MIPSLAEIQRSVFGAWRLARFDPGGMAFFDLSIPGFWRSFGVAILLLPAFVYLRAIGPDTLPESAGSGSGVAWVMLVEFVAYAVDWVIFPVVMIFIARFLDLQANYVAYIVALNWSAVIRMALLIPTATAAYLLPEGEASMLMLVATFAIWIYAWFVTRTALQTSGSTSVALVVLNVLISVAISLGAREMM